MFVPQLIDNQTFFVVLFLDKTERIFERDFGKYFN